MSAHLKPCTQNTGSSCANAYNLQLLYMYYVMLIISFLIQTSFKANGELHMIHVSPQWHRQTLRLNDVE